MSKRESRTVIEGKLLQKKGKRNLSWLPHCMCVCCGCTKQKCVGLTGIRIGDLREFQAEASPTVWHIDNHCMFDIRIANYELTCVVRKTPAWDCVEPTDNLASQ